MYTEEERAKFKKRFQRWKETRERQYEAGRPIEVSDNTRVNRQQVVEPIKRDFIAEAQRKHAAEAVGPDTRSSYQQKQSQAAKQYANQQYQKAKDDAKRAEGLEQMMKTVSPSTYVEAATGQDLGTVGRLAADVAMSGITAIPKKISSKVIKDAAYKAAVESGNKQEAYRLLEEAYLNSGVQKTPITITSDGKAVGWYHGSEWGNHTIFDSSAMNATIGGTSAAGKVKGNFLTTDFPSAVRYAGTGRWQSVADPKTTVPTTFWEKMQNLFGKYKPRTLYPAERVGELGPKPGRLFDTEGKAPINHLDKTDKVVYPLYVNPGENPMILDFEGRPWSRSPVEFPNNFYLKRWIRDDAAKTYRDEIVPFNSKEEAMAAWEADPINVYKGNTDLEGKYFDEGIRYIEGYNSTPRYETVKLVEEIVPNTTNGAVQTAARQGNTSVLMRNVIDSNGGPNGVHYAIDDFVTLKPEQMKLADITYDDAGNLIPLSQRFNWNLKDIRYGITPLLAGGTGYSLYNKYADSDTRMKLPKFEDGKGSNYFRPNGNQIKIDENTGELVDLVNGERGTLQLPEITVKPKHYDAYHSAYDPNAIRAFTDWAPIVGDIGFGKDAYDAIQNKNYKEAALLGAMMVLPGASGKLLKPVSKYLKNFNYFNPTSRLNKNIRTSLANNRNPYGYNIFDPNNVMPFIEGFGNTIIGRDIKLKDLSKISTSNRNRHIAWRKYLGVGGDEHLVNSLTGRDYGSYVLQPNGKYTVRPESREAYDFLNQDYVYTLLNKKGKYLVDAPLGNHGTMGHSVLSTTNSEFPGILHYYDTWDLQPFRSMSLLPKRVREFEVSSILPGAKPFTFEGYAPMSKKAYEEYQHAIKSKEGWDKLVPNDYGGNAALIGVGLGLTAAPAATYGMLEGSKWLVGKAVDYFSKVDYFNKEKYTKNENITK